MANKDELPKGIGGSTIKEPTPPDPSDREGLNAFTDPDGSRRKFAAYVAELLQERNLQKSPN